MTGTFNETLQDATDAKPTSTSSESTEPTGDANSNSDSDDDDSSAARNTAFAAMGATILGASIYLL